MISHHMPSPILILHCFTSYLHIKNNKCIATRQDSLLPWGLPHVVNYKPLLTTSRINLSACECTKALMCLHVCWGVAASLSHSAARGACGSPHPLVVLENKHVVLTRLTAKAPLRVHSDLLLGSLLLGVQRHVFHHREHAVKTNPDGVWADVVALLVGSCQCVWRKDFLGRKEEECKVKIYTHVNRSCGVFVALCWRLKIEQQLTETINVTSDLVVFISFLCKWGLHSAASSSFCAMKAATVTINNTEKTTA